MGVPETICMNYHTCIKTLTARIVDSASIAFHYPQERIQTTKDGEGVGLMRTMVGKTTANTMKNDMFSFRFRYLCVRQSEWRN